MVKILLSQCNISDVGIIRRLLFSNLHHPCSTQETICLVFNVHNLYFLFLVYIFYFSLSVFFLCDVFECCLWYSLHVSAWRSNRLLYLIVVIFCNFGWLNFQTILLDNCCKEKNQSLSLLHLMSRIN